MSTDPTNAARQRRWRDRQAGRLPPAPRPSCSSCGIQHTGAHGPLCCRCWERITPEGKAAKRERVRLAKARRKARQQHSTT